MSNDANSPQGGTGDPPVPSGDSPDGKTARRSPTPTKLPSADAPLNPVGESPAGAGGSPAPPAQPPPPAKPVNRPWLSWAIVAVLVIVVGCGVWRYHAAPKDAAGDAAATTVAVAKVERQDLYNEVKVAAEFRPFVEVQLHAKVSGFVDKMNVDFGDKVKAGQLLATLEVPELADELDEAKATQGRDEADYQNAHLIFTRLVGVNNTESNLVAQQDIDTADAKEKAAAAAVASAKADVEKYKTLFDYTQITAPFDGVVTWRYADPGTLIQAGTASDTQSLPLVRVSDNYLLRLDFPVSVAYAKDIHLGDKVNVRVQSLDEKLYTGKVTRFTDRVNEDTRTMITEIEVPNPNLELIPGMYASVVFRVGGQRTQVLSVPIEAVAIGAKSTVDVVNNQGEIEERAVQLGLETPTRCEVVSGLKEGELVMIGGRSSVHPGEKVETKPWQAPALP